MGISFNNLRVGKRYRLVNHREEFDFEIMEVVSKSNFRLKDIHTLEEYFMADLLMFGRGKDFHVTEL